MFTQSHVFQEPRIGYKDENQRKHEFAFIEPIVFETQTHKLVWNPSYEKYNRVMTKVMGLCEHKEHLLELWKTSKASGWANYCSNSRISVV